MEFGVPAGVISRLGGAGFCSVMGWGSECPRGLAGCCLAVGGCEPVALRWPGRGTLFASDRGWFAGLGIRVSPGLAGCCLAVGVRGLC
jgi:hypothetical protein